MPEKGFSKARFGEHIRKYSPLYICCSLVFLLVTSLIYSVTRPVTPPEREILIQMVDKYAAVDRLEPLEKDALAYGRTVDETLENVEFQHVLYNDPMNDPNSTYLLMTRMIDGTSDAFIGNSDASGYLLQGEVALPLDDYLANGWMEGLDLPTITFINEETGEEYIAALRLDNVTALSENGIFNNESACLIVAVNGTNIDTTMATLDYMIRSLMEGYDAFA